MLKYLEDQFLYEYKAKIEAIKKGEDGRDIIVLNDTIFYPKGGGQPNDVGEIKQGENVFEVVDVRMVDNEVHHIGQYKSGKLQVGEEAELKIDEAKRKEYSAIHSVGHLIDESLFKLGYYDYLIPTKAFFYPEGPSVEFDGDLSKFSLEDIKIEIEEDINKMIQNGFATKTIFISAEEVEKYCHSITMDSKLIEERQTQDKKVRVIILWGEKGVTCGGTHVQNINMIPNVKIKKISNKKNKVKVSYNLS